MTEFEIDWEREARTGVPEVILCGSKTAAQIGAILDAAQDRRLLLTRLDPDKHDALSSGIIASMDYDPLSRTAFYGKPPQALIAGVGIVCAGTSDLPVAREAARCLAFFGYDAPIIADVGVAGLWRLMRRIEDIRDFSLVIAIAGMEGALFSVLAGLIEAPLIAVPTSVGYGVSEGGRAALSSALASCAPGLTAVNIDNGFGAAAAAVRIMRQIRKPL
ncbi:nickel pincer cofactor biosynthesis protein LarB [Consotaella aegiceratis]|uniref:nickel pincer cofactor biosynthesis protein LarB n=1 Tax=Consotaella aegiceratis TaxID=3097961 RepID=UPI002F4138FC